MTTRNIFAQSEPLPGATFRDLTQATLVCDLTNSIGEKFHYEVAPGQNLDAVKRMATPRTTSGVGKNPGAYVELQAPFA